MNLWFWLDFNPKTFRESWNWLPKCRYKGWPISKGGKVWYLRINWLNAGFTADNEW